VWPARRGRRVVQGGQLPADRLHLAGQVGELRIVQDPEPAVLGMLAQIIHRRLQRLQPVDDPRIAHTRTLRTTTDNFRPFATTIPREILANFAPRKLSAR
jgi:hypothetical protein